MNSKVLSIVLQHMVYMALVHAHVLFHLFEHTSLKLDQAVPPPIKEVTDLILVEVFPLAFAFSFQDFPLVYRVLINKFALDLELSTYFHHFLAKSNTHELHDWSICSQWYTTSKVSLRVVVVFLLLLDLLRVFLGWNMLLRFHPLQVWFFFLEEEIFEWCQDVCFPNSS